MELVKYDAACRAIAEAKTIDDVKEISNRAEAARAYARQAKNRQLELDALEIRTRAERKLGEIIISLKQAHVISGGGARGNKPDRLTMDDLGIDPNISGSAQRLAKIPDPRFTTLMKGWRENAETARSVEVPLQAFRKPSLKGDRQMTSHKLGRHKVDEGDQTARFTTMDGRRVADWRIGELDRLDELAVRVRRCVEVLKSNLPVPNDPLDTMEMIFGTKLLVGILTPIWEQPISQPYTGVESGRPAGQRRICGHCGVSFKPSSGIHKNRPYEGKFCSRSCAGKATASRRCGT